MKKSFLYGCALILLSALFVLTACPTEVSGSDPDPEPITTPEPDPTPEPTPDPDPAPTPEPAPAFSRPSAATVYTLTAYNPANSAATLKKAGETEGTDYTITEAGLKTLFNAIYSPNAPGSAADSIESGKTTTAYTAAISQAVLNLFKITLGPSTTKVDITGTALPAAAGSSATQPIVIDVGIPGASDNSGLPVFYIPYKGLGDAGLNGDYSHIRLRVNNGASLVILADNSGYLENAGVGHPCEDGYFKGGAVEVMAGGYLRDGAYEGFPLGGSAVILNRYNSYLAIGPEPGSSDANAFTNYERYYGGWLLGPEAGSPRILWDTTGNAASSYLEVRPGVIATDAKLTAKKSLGLIYSVWFVGNAGLTIDATGETDVVFTQDNQTIHGIFANEFGDSPPDYNFYGSSSTTITIKTGNVLDGNFLQANSEGKANPIMATGSDTTISGTSTGNPVPYADPSTGIVGILIPAPTN